MQAGWESAEVARIQVPAHSLDTAACRVQCMQIGTGLKGLSSYAPNEGIFWCPVDLQLSKHSAEAKPITTPSITEQWRCHDVPAASWEAGTLQPTFRAAFMADTLLHSPPDSIIARTVVMQWRSRAQFSQPLGCEYSYHSLGGHLLGTPCWQTCQDPRLTAGLQIEQLLNLI